MLPFRLTLKLSDPIVLPPYKGSTFRGGFGHAFKKVVCTIRDKTCDECLLISKCIYSYVFETPPPEDSQILRKYEKAPHPFVIEPPIEIKTRYLPGDTLNFGLILLGKATDYLPYFIYAFEELGKIGIGKGRGKYKLTLVSCEEKVIYDSDSRQLKQITANCPDIASILSNPSIPATQNSKLTTLNFLTPTRIIINEDLVVDLEFHYLIRSLLRRISTLSYFHYGERLALDFKGLIERAQGE